MGDPCGIGPEIILKALKSSYNKTLNQFVIIGSYYALATVNQKLSINMPIKKISDFDEFDTNEDEKIQILDPENIDTKFINPGILSKEAGKACMEWVEIAAHLCLENKIQGMATAPVNKEAAALAGYVQIGHMELLQSITESPEVATMLISKNLRVVHLTTHKPVQIACDFVTKENISQFPNLVKFINELQSKEVYQTISKMINKDLSNSYVRVEVICDREGFWLKPHCDIKEKLMSGLIFVNNANESEELGTDFYNQKLEKVKTVPYKHNYGYLFTSGPNTWHGMEKKKIVKERRCVQVNYVTFETDWKVNT